MKIGIIGTAGRDKAMMPRMTKDLYFKMTRAVNRTIQGLNIKPEGIELVSGGAAWSDHVAVSLFKMGQAKELWLHLPAQWDFEYQEFLDNGGRGFGNPGGTANYYHRLFSQKIGAGGNGTLQSLNELLSEGGSGHAHHSIHNGFHARNIAVGNVDYLIALTWGEGSTPADGGTSHTWNNSKARNKIHISLHTL